MKTSDTDSVVALHGRGRTSGSMARMNDGKVSVASTRLEGMADHVALPVTRAFLMHDSAVIAAALCFLRDGRFSRESCRGSPAS